MSAIAHGPTSDSGRRTGDSHAADRRWDRAFFAASSSLALLGLLILLRPLVAPAVTGTDHYVYLANHLLRGDLTVDDPFPLPLKTVWSYYGTTTGVPLEHHEGARVAVELFRVTRDFIPSHPPPRT